MLQQRIRAAMGPRAPSDPLVVPTAPSEQQKLVTAGASARDVARLYALQARGSPYLVYLAPGQG